MQKRIIKLIALVILPYLYISCVMDYTPLGYRIRNCTKDTLYMGLSDCENIDSVGEFLSLDRLVTDTCPPSESILLCDGINVSGSEIPPSSEVAFFPLSREMSLFLFSIKRQTAKQYSWQEIKSKKLYDKCHLIYKDFNGKRVFEYKTTSSVYKKIQNN